MNLLWLQVIAIAIGGVCLKSLINYRLAWVCIDLIVFGIVYLLLRRHSFVNFKSSILCLGGLTVVNVLTDLSVISVLLGNLLSLAVVVWMIWRIGNDDNDNWRRKRQTLRHKWHK